MKRILVIITTSFVSYGGLTTVAMNYYRHINKSIFKVDFASTNDITESLENEICTSGSRYYKLPKRSNVISYFIALVRLLKGYEIVHVHANSATSTIELLAAVIAKVQKRIIHIHNTTCTHMTAHKVLKPIFDICYTDAVACSKKAGEWIFNKHNFMVLNNAVDMDKYSFNLVDRMTIRSRYKISEKQVVVGHVGKINEQKNHLFVIEVFMEYLKTCSNAVLVLVGDGPMRKVIEDRCRECGIDQNVVFCGMVQNAKEYYSAFDCILFPSLWEGLPLSLIEAQANGLLCVASDTITSEVNMGGVVQLSLNDSTHMWRNAIETVLKQDRDELITTLRQNIKQNGFDINDNAKRLEELYLKN